MCKRRSTPSAAFVPSRPKIAGIALIEALFALAVVVAGAAALFGIHAFVMGGSAESRLQTAAMALAQDKLEELRSDALWVVFPDTQTEPLVASDAPPLIMNPGIVRSAAVSLSRCWRLEQVLPADTNEPATLVEARVQVVRAGSVCDPQSDGGLANLQTLLARQDPRIAAQNVAERLSADGDGILVDNYPYDPDVSDPLPGGGGFEEIRDPDTGELVAIVNPDTGQAILPRDNPLRYATISGNIVLEGARTAAGVNVLRLRPEGVAMCRLYYPGFPAAGEDPPPEPPSITGDGQTVSHVQYSCVVADQWRREILLSPMLSERVCVGYPALLAQDGLLLVRELRIIGGRRFYVGRHYTGSGWQRDPEGEPELLNGEKVKIRVGMRGGFDEDTGVADDSARIGSLCGEDQPCWDDVSLKALVPGGHHFFVMGVGENFDPETGDSACATAMGALGLIDAANALVEEGTLYANILERNMSNVYCTNEKDYTASLDPANLDASECVSNTRISGFMTGSEVFSGTDLDLVTPAPGRLFCHAMGRFQGDGGAYLCGFQDGENVDISVSPEGTGLAFSPAATDVHDPMDWPHDIVSEDFNFSSALPD